MERSHTQKEIEHNETEKEWKPRRTGALVIALLVVALDILALTLGTIIPVVSVALAMGCVGIITFVGVLMLSNYLSGDPKLAKKEMRKAIAASFILVYLVFLAFVIFSEASPTETKLTETVVAHFTYMVGIVIGFYFGSRLLEEYRKSKE